MNKSWWVVVLVCLGYPNQYYTTVVLRAEGRGLAASDALRKAEGNSLLHLQVASTVGPFSSDTVSPSVKEYETWDA